MKVTIKIFFLFIIFTKILYALDISQESSNIDLLSSSKYYLDCNKHYVIDNVKKAPFQNIEKETLAFGIVPKCSLWIRFQLHNTTNKRVSKIIEYANSKSEDVYFYDGNKTYIDGMLHIDKGIRSSLNPAFSIKLKPDETRTYYIQSHSKIATLIAKVKLYNREDFLLYDLKKQFHLIIFFSVISVLLFYNLMLYIFTKDSAYLFYTFYMISMIIFEAIYSGMAHLYLFSNEVSIFITKAALFYLSLLAISMILFLMKFLRTKRFTRLHKLLKSYLYILPIISILGYDNIIFNLNVMIVYIILVVLIITTALYAYFQKTKEAFYYLIGWSFVLASILLSTLKALGIFNIGIDYLNELAFTFEALMFSIALAHRIKILAEEKERINQQLIELQQKEKEELEKLVAQRTKELIASLEEKELLYSELNHRVKNNLQMILSLIKLQINNTTSQDTKEQLTITKNRINSISKLYEILYLKNDLNRLDTLKYFKYIVSTIEKNFNKNIKVTYDIRHNISVENLIYCGLILNELVTNSFKYAFKDEGEITIEIYKERDKTHMNIKDNGIGFDKEVKNSLGLTIVQTLVQKQLLGEITIDSTNGTCTMTNWKET